jgi:hypothetical protein
MKESEILEAIVRVLEGADITEAGCTKESEPKQPADSLATDAETHTEIVQQIAHRRPREEARRNPRFPTSEALSGDFVSPVPFGLFVCGAQGACEMGNGTAVSDSNLPAHQPRPREDLEIIGGFHVVEFSEAGMQIQFPCGNPRKYSMNQLYLRIGDSLIPVGLQWLYERDGIIRAGVSFHEDLEQSTTLTGFLVGLSDRVIDFLTHRYIADNTQESKEIAVFAYFCILYNLRLRYIQALSLFNETKSGLKPFNTSDIQSHHLRRAARYYTYSEYLQIHSTISIVNIEEYKKVFDVFVKPYYEVGCGISGAEGRVVFLEQEIDSIVSNCLLFQEGETHQSDGFTGPLPSVYSCFVRLRELLPELFQSGTFTQQFEHYSSLIRSILLTREALMNPVSNPGLGQASSGADAGRFPAQDPKPDS